ncbi:MAG: hypothetical protein WC392_14830 [Sulfuricella sp.]|jgi:hypothetical protein
MLVADLPPVPAQETPIVWMQTVPRFGEDGARLDGVRNEATCGAMPVGYCALRGLGLNQGEFAMFVLDQPDMPPSMPTIMVAEKANLGQQLVAGRLSTLGVCEILNLNRSSQVDVYSTIVANMYFNTYKAKIDAETAIVRVIRQPAHGSLEPNPGWNEARYVPNDGYTGKDFFILEVEGNGYKVRLQYFLLVTADDGEVNNPACKTPGQIPGHWKIFLNPAPDYTSDIQPLLTYTGISNFITLNIADLPGTAVAQTSGPTITFDDNAAGFGWFVDATPGQPA